MACDDGWAVLNDYWKKSDDQTAIVISLILDPRIKLEGLECLGWTRTDRSKAKAHFERIYKTTYQQAADPVPSPAIDKASYPLASFFQSISESQESESEPEYTSIRSSDR